MDLREPRRFKVWLINDDFTTMQFVVELLRTVFHKTEQEAEALMLTVHNKGRAVVGIYSYDTAKTKTQIATNMAMEQGFPLRLTYEPE